MHDGTRVSWPTGWLPGADRQERGNCQAYGKAFAHFHMQCYNQTLGCIHKSQKPGPGHNVQPKPLTLLVSSTAAWSAADLASWLEGMRKTALSVSRLTATLCTPGCAERMRLTEAEQPPHFMLLTSNTTLSKSSAGQVLKLSTVSQQLRLQQPRERLLCLRRLSGSTRACQT